LAKLYQKLAILAISGTVSPHFKSDNGEIQHESAGLELPTHAKFCKNCLRGYSSFGQIYTKN